MADALQPKIIWRAQGEGLHEGVHIEFYDNGDVTIWYRATLFRVLSDSGPAPRENTQNLRAWIKLLARPAIGTSTLASPSSPSAPTKLQSELSGDG